MKAAVVDKVGSFDNLKVVELPEPKAGPGQILVRLRAASLNYRDILAVQGGYGSTQKRENLIPLSDGAGEVVEVGPGVRAWKAGDRVVGCFFPKWLTGQPNERRVAVNLGGSVDGVAAEYRVFDEDEVLAIPQHLSFAEAATLPCAALTAWTAVISQGQAGPGQTVLTQGTGGVSLFALQFAAAAGAEVIATSSSAEKLARLKALGATHVINYTEDAKWGDTARKLQAGGGVDVIVEIGGAQTISQSLRALRMGGFISIIGVVTGPRHELNVPVMVMKNVRMQGASVGSTDQFGAMLRAIAHHGIKPVIDRTFPLADIHGAFAYMQTGQHVGKICLEI
jgi:alcohol dehydrogenase